MKLKLFNTQTRQKEEIYPSDGKTVRMYTCGPTVYNFAHIGNFRTYVFEDVLRRTIKFTGLKITQAMNITDVDDKTIKGAVAEQITLEAFTTRYKDAFFEDLKALNIEKVEFYPLATDYIDDMICIIESLLEKKVAYKGSDGSIYYAIDKFASYGKLSHLEQNQLKSGASNRVHADEYDKESASDFVLWKAHDPKRDEYIFWQSPFGPGRPGWHIECSAMALKLLGDTLDIHVGGVDNMFPHHENEIAQSEAHTHKCFAHHWAHSEHLLVDNKKMSKSLGNFYTLRDLLVKGYTGMQVRYMLLQAHYRTQLNFTLSGLDAAATSLQRIQDFILRLKSITKTEDGGEVSSLIKKGMEAFSSALCDDLNTPQGLAALFDTIREVNALCDKSSVSQKEARDVLDFMHSINQVLGVVSFEDNVESFPEEVLYLLGMREKARLSRNWKDADSFRDELLAKGYVIEDTLQGARLKKKRVNE